ncbi:Putative vacuolar protein sorting-associated protein Vps41/Vps8 [Septoria linicola]|uniref:Vacuolar protein sorting-associated protein Vps41/Vps8 n=1 Tax=Septoria linicola TaxID=215465 RepID=A0A9Q9AYV8_9PEZI|nr:putative vacuolar protein sorting-associated protein Vps41/Vps8 [Septoria linicola]USW54402.1 Putative vacuolar protein sorting-associated protein Vps41/Vps8 [Septoria linicola]
MSSVTGDAHEGGSNEDEEADESIRDAEGRLEDALDHHGDEDVEYGDFEEPVPQEEVLAAEEGVLPEVEGNESTDDMAVETAEDQDYAQLGRGEKDSEQEGTEVGPSTPQAQRSPLGSMLDSGSIPDDTPSRAGSILSSPVRDASPLPRRIAERKAVTRTPSGALQPFERRFETRLSASPGSPRAQSPAFLTPHSRQISISSQLSGISSDAGDSATDTPQAPWDVVRWTKLRKLTSQAFSESGKRSFGRPTCMAVSALIAIGTSKGLVLGFDYHQTLKIIIGPGTKATECGSVTSLAIAADYSTVASGHANGTIFTWEVSRPSRPFMQIPPLDRSILEQRSHADGHLEGCAILHVGFLGTRHTALVSADAGGMAFSHLATRGLGAVTRSIKSTRLLGRYPPASPQEERARKPSSVLAFSPLPLGNVEQATDGMGLTALLTPYLLVIVSTTPVAQTQHKSPRPKDVTPHSTLSGCLAWFPAVKLKSSSADAEKGNSDTKLVYCWSNVLTILDVKVIEANEGDKQKLPTLEFNARNRWRADEAIVAVQWLGRSVLGVLTISQRLLIVEDGTLQVTDSIDLLHRHIYHQDLFSHQLQSVVERLDSDDPSLHGVVADACYMSYKAYKGRTFLLGFNDLTVGTLSNWADRLMAFMENGDHISAIRLATEYYSGSANNVVIGLPDADAARHEIVRERILAMISASLNYTFAQQDEDRDSRLKELAEVCFEACVTMKELDYLCSTVFDTFEESHEASVFIATLEPYILDGELTTLPPAVVTAAVSHFISENEAARLEELLIRLEPHSFDLDQVTMLCRQHSLYDALIYIWTQALRDFVTPLIDLLSLVKMLQEGDEDEDLSHNPFYESAIKTYPYLAYSLTGRRYPGGAYMDEDEAHRARTDLYDYLFSGTAIAWPQGSRKVFHTAHDVSEEPAFPYLDLLLQFDAASFMSMLNEAFEDPFLNEPDEENGINGLGHSNGISGKKKSRQQIIEIMLDVMRQGDFDADHVVYLDMFVARSMSKYPGQLILTGTLLNGVLQRLCRPPSEALREDCQLSAEYLLSVYHPSNTAVLIEALRQAKFFRVLKTVYRGERMLTELLSAFFEDPEDKEKVFECITFCLHENPGLTQRQLAAIKEIMNEHAQDLANIDVVAMSHTIATTAPDLLQSSIDSLSDSHQQFIFLRALLEPTLLRGRSQAASPLAQDQQAAFTEQYVRLMCSHEPLHVADYIKTLPTSDLRLDEVLPAMEQSGVIDAAVALLARDGLARDAMERLVSHMQSLQHALTSLLHSATTNPEVTASQDTSDDLFEDLEKYTKVGIWLCQGQSATAERTSRPRSNIAWDIDENDLDMDEYLWLSLVDIIVQVNQNVGTSIQHYERHPSAHDHDPLDTNKLASSLRANVQQTFTALLAATAVPSVKSPSATARAARKSADDLSFLRVLRAFLTRAAKSAPSLSELRAVLADIFSAYTFEQSVLELAHGLLGADVFTEIEEVNNLRQRGWRPRSQVCEHCKRRAWGPGTGEVVWEEWILEEQERESEKTRKMLERGGGEQARRLSRGKGKMSVPSTPGLGPTVGQEEMRKLSLVVFAYTDPNKCQALVSAGQWYNGRTWVVPGCTTIHHDGSKIKQCAGKEKRKFTFIGDLHTQRLYFQLGRRLDHDIQVPGNRKQDLRLTKDNVEVQFFYDPYLNGSGFLETTAAYRDGKYRPLLTIVGAANAHVEHAMTGEYVMMAKTLAASTQVSHVGQRFTYDQGPGDLLLFTPAEEPYTDHPDTDASSEPYRKLNDKLLEVADSSFLRSFRHMVSGRRDLYKEEGLRVTNEVIKQRVDLLLNLRCNAAVGSRGHFPNRAICCGVWRRPNWFQTIFLMLGLAVLPSIVLVDIKLALLSERSRPVVRAFCAFMSAVSLQWITDRTHIFDQATRLDLFKPNLYLMIAITFFLGLITTRRSKPARKAGLDNTTTDLPFLPRDQTDEWKGWMQALIIIYHYNKGWKFFEFWQVVRLTVSSYLFLTGFGHTIYFLQKKDYSLRRFTNVMIRTNLLPVTLAYVMRTRWLLYYYMPLSTFNFVVVYVTLALGRRYNEYTAFLIGKIAAAAYLVHVFLTTKDLPVTVVHFFRITCKLNFDSGEFFGHRVDQDKFIVFVGMVAAIVHIYVRAAVETGDRQDRFSKQFRKVWPMVKWSAVVVAGVGHALFWYWVRTHIKGPEHWRELQPYITGLPILSFIVLRNFHPALRNWHSVAFAWLGRYSGEMYVMQDHLWLGDDQQAILRTGLFHGNETLLGDRWRDVVLVTPLYLLACSIVGDATGVIAEWFIKENVPPQRESHTLVRQVDEVEMGLLADQSLTADNELVYNEKAKGDFSWWSTTAPRLLPHRYWPGRLKHRVLLVLAIMWALNMAYT